MKQSICPSVCQALSCHTYLTGPAGLGARKWANRMLRDHRMDVSVTPTSPHFIPGYRHLGAHYPVSFPIKAKNHCLLIPLLPPLQDFSTLLVTGCLATLRWFPYLCHISNASLPWVSCLFPVWIFMILCLSLSINSSSRREDGSSFDIKVKTRVHILFRPSTWHHNQH